jgi:hypothetical protein
MNLKESKIIKLILLLCLIVFVFSLFTPFIFTRSSFFESLDFTETGPIGDTIGGILNPFLAIIGMLLTFLAFYIQYSANKAQLKQFNKTQEKQNELLKEQQYFRIVENLNQKIFSFSTSGNSSYEAINEIIKEYKNREKSQCFELGRYILTKKTHLLNETDFSKLERKLIELNFNEFAVKNLKKDIFNLDENERWEFMKRFVKVYENNDNELNEIVAGFCRINFYKLNWDEKQGFYSNCFDQINSKYSGFINSYIKNLFFLLKFIEVNDENKFYREYFIGNLSIEENLLIYYYTSSYKASLEFINLIKKFNLFDDLLNFREKFIDIPREEQLKSEIELILNRTVYNTV